MEIQELREEDHMLMEKTKSFEKRISNLERRHTATTVREAMRLLERCICLESTGSKAKFLTKFFNFNWIISSGDRTMITNFQTVLGKLGLTTDHLEYLSCLKDGGYLACDNRPQMTKAEWDALLVDDAMYQDDENKVDTLKQWKGLIDSLATYIPPPRDPSEPWTIIDPEILPLSQRKP